MGVGFCCSVLFGCLCWLNPYVGDWLMFIRCIFVRADASFVFFFFWIIKNFFPKRAEPQQQLKNSTKPAAIREYENGQHLP